MDQRVPDNIIEFVKFINKLVNIISGLTNCEKLYIHCKGGHGRSGLIAATLLCVMDEISPEKAIKETTLSHNQRHMMKKKWKKKDLLKPKLNVIFCIIFLDPKI